jgi:hypothetical protein
MMNDELMLMDFLNGFFGNQVVSGLFTILFFVMIVWFLVMYTESVMHDKKVEQARATVAEKDAVIKRDEERRKQLAADKFAAITEVKILRELLAESRKTIEWEQYKNTQLMRGVVLTDEQRQAFERERSRSVSRLNK